jgi:hypothetical protein
MPVSFMRYFIIIFLLLFARASFGQGYVTTTTERSKASVAATPSARDFWFAIPQNYDPKDATGEIFTFYITSQVNTSVHIQIQGQAVVTKPVSANQVLNYVVPRSLEINRSSAIETDKSIHIWSEDTDLNVYFMSRNDFTSDGTVVLPSYAYGKEYVVAAATALYVNSSVDLPSEFIIIATQDSTVVTVKPSQDIRKEGVPTEVKYPKNIPFNVTLNKGECIQYQTTQSQDIPWDLSGTILTSNNPIAVIGASACPFIPADPYCDHVVEMIPPSDKWGKKYYSMQFAGRKYGGDSFLLISSKDNQTIYRNGTPYATLGKFEAYYRDDITGANVWSSDAPFLLAQYINSSTYGVPANQTRNSGDPAMLIIYPTEKAKKSILFQIPNITPGSGQAGFTNYVNILLPTLAVPSTKMDNKLLTDFIGYSRFPIAGTSWEAFRIPNAAIGRHTVVSDSGISAYAYGYSSEDDSSAWFVPGKLLPVSSIDTVAPTATIKQSCYCTDVVVKDVHPNSAKLLVADSDFVNNMDVTVPDIIAGQDSAAFRICVKDSSSAASVAIHVFDNGGNKIDIFSTYGEMNYFKSITPKISFGNVSAQQSASKLAEIQKVGPVKDSLLSFRLQYGNQGFVIDSAASFSFAGGEIKNYKILFTSPGNGNYTDTLIYISKCQTNRIPLIAGTEKPEGRVPDSIYVGCIPVGDTLEGNVIFTNANSYTLTIKEIRQYGSANFELDGTPTLPKTVIPANTAKIGIRFIPRTAEQFNGLLTVVYETADAVIDSVSTKLAGCGLDLGVHDQPDIHILPTNSPDYTHAIERLNRTDERLFVQSITPNPASSEVVCTYALENDGHFSMELLDMLGKVVNRVFASKYHSKGAYEARFTVAELPSGAYICRVSGADGVASARVVVRH